MKIANNHGFDTDKQLPGLFLNFPRRCQAALAGTWNRVNGANCLSSKDM